jgi:hypothetical protein
MKENKCFPEGSNLMETMDFYFHVRTFLKYLSPEFIAMGRLKIDNVRKMLSILHSKQLLMNKS